MAAAGAARLTFVDEDDIPLAFLRVVHVDSEDEAPSGIDSDESEDSSDESDHEDQRNEAAEEPNYENLRWSSHIQRPQGRAFTEQVGMRIEMGENKAYLNYFQLLFTDDVYQLIVDETVRFERQKRQLDNNSPGNLHDFSDPELKAWLGLTLAMGLVKKANLKSYWSLTSVATTPGVDLGDQRLATCSRLMKGNIWYYKIFFHMLEVSVLNALILYQKDTHQHVTLNDFKEGLIRQLIGSNSFRRDTLPARNEAGLQDVRFNRQQFHHPVARDTHRNCKVHIQRVETIYECSVCQVRMCPAPCFERYHTLQGYLFDDPSRNGPKRLKDCNGRARAGPGRPPQRRSR